MTGSVDGLPSAEERFAAVVEALGAEPGVTPPDVSGGRRFGSAALKVHGSIFAMVTRGHHVVKLPHARVAELIAQGVGGPFDAGKGKPMREWLTVLDEDEETWLELAREALDFVGRRNETSGKRVHPDSTRR